MNALNQKVYIHVGLHKTGTTFLQQSFLPNFAKTTGYVPLRGKNSLHAFKEYVLREHDFTYDPSVAKKLFLEAHSSIGSNSEKITLSEEQFSGSPWNNAKDRKRNIDRLLELFPNASIILVLRKQETMTQSLYHEYIKKGGTVHWEQFLRIKRNDLEFSRGDYLNYGVYYEYLSSRVSAQNVLVLCYEEMVEDPTSFFSKLFQFYGVDEKVPEELLEKQNNTSIRGKNIHKLRWMNKLAATDRNPNLLLPHKFSVVFKRFLLRFPNKGTFVIPEDKVTAFCKTPKKDNHKLPNQNQLLKYGYDV